MTISYTWSRCSSVRARGLPERDLEALSIREASRRIVDLIVERLSSGCNLRIRLGDNPKVDSSQMRERICGLNSRRTILNSI